MRDGADLRRARIHTRRFLTRDLWLARLREQQMAAPHLNSSARAPDDGVADKQLGKRDLRNIHCFPLTAADRQPRITNAGPR